MVVSTERLYGVLVIFIALCATPALANFNESQQWTQNPDNSSDPEEGNRTVVARRYPMVNLHMEEEGIYTGVQEPETFLIFPLRWKQVLMCEEIKGENLCKRKRLLLRDETPIMASNMTETAVCSQSNGIHGTKELHHALSTPKRFMALWTFSVPAKSCIQIFFKTYNLNVTNKLYIKTGDWIDHIVSDKRRRFIYERLALNSSVISIAYSHMVHTTEKPVINFSLRLSTLQCVCPVRK